ncbi:MAG: Na+/H+ antiporter NhaC family protein, partial [Clostridiales bacterium]
MENSTEQKMPSQPSQPSMKASTFMLISLIIVLLGGNIFFHFNLSIMLAFSFLILYCLARPLGYTFNQLIQIGCRAIGEQFLGIFFLFIVGMLVGSWIYSGTVPAIIYYGLAIIKPGIFLPLTFLLCTVCTFFMGTSWGAAATMGFALLGVGISMNIPAPAIVGAIVSGVSLGDTCSPLSATATVSTNLAGSDIHKHIKTIMPVYCLTFLVCLILFAWLGMDYASQSVDNNRQI